MVRPYRMSVFWEHRECSVRECAEGVLQMMKALGASDPGMLSWYPSDGVSGAAVDVDAVSRCLLSGEQAWEHGGREFRAFAAQWSNAEPSGLRVTLDFLCGVDAPSMNVWFPNRLDLSFFGPDTLDGFVDMWLVERWLDIAVAIFEPRWAAVGPEGLAEANIDDVLDGRPAVSWMLYLATAYGVPPPTEMPTAVRQLRGGYLYIVVPDWYDLNEPSHRAATTRLREVLDVAQMRPRSVPLE